MTKAPAFQFYPKDWLSDSNVKAMTLEAKGAYIDLLGIYWLEDGLPADTDRLARLIGVAPAKFRRLWPLIEPCFRIEGSRLIQKRMEREKAKQVAFRAVQSRNGSKGGRPNIINTDKKPSVSQPQSEIEAKKSSAVCRLQSPEETDPGATAPVASERPAAVVPAPKRSHPTWLTRPGDLWRERWGTESEPPFGEMASALSRPYKAFESRGDLDDLWARWERFLAAATTSLWARPARFVQGLGEWAEGAVRAPPRHGPKSLDDRAMDSAREAIEAHKARAK